MLACAVVSICKGCGHYDKMINCYFAHIGTKKKISIQFISDKNKGMDQGLIFLKSATQYDPSLSTVFILTLHELPTLRQW